MLHCHQLLGNLVWVTLLVSAVGMMMMPARRSMMMRRTVLNAAPSSSSSGRWSSGDGLETTPCRRRPPAFRVFSGQYLHEQFSGRLRIADITLRASSSSSSSPESIILRDQEGDEDEEEEEGFEEIEEEEEQQDEPTTINLPKGTSEGFYVVKTYHTEKEQGFDMEKIQRLVDAEDVQRLDLTSHNISVPVALMMLDEIEYPSISRARKACRKNNIMIHRGPLGIDSELGTAVFNSTRCVRARVGDRMFPGDVLGKQVRMGNGYFPVMNHKRPPFDLPVVYEDDYFAICNKPAGVVVYAQRGGGHGLMTIRAALPFAVAPPKLGTVSALRRPQPVHRLDKPTSGLLLVAKTKPAMVNLSMQFRDRIVKKTYTAVINGIPPEPQSSRLTSKEAHALGVDIDPDDSSDWQLIDHPLDEKSATTVWRAVKYAKSLKGEDNYVTLVELKPKTGRYHQLRRHMAWVCERPIIGDVTYDGAGPAIQLRGSGMFLCSNQVTLQHPYYNTPIGREDFQGMSPTELAAKGCIWRAEDGTVMVTASIPLPDKFESFMKREHTRYESLSIE